MVRNPRFFTDDDDDSVVFIWEPPFAQGGPTPSYYYNYGSSGDKEAPQRTFKIKRDLQDRTYTVTVCCLSSNCK